MKRCARVALYVAVALVTLVILLPLVWPVPPLTDTRPVTQLAGEDSRFVEVEGVRIHYVEAGSRAAERTFILMHGFGASTFSWRDQLELLSDRGRVIAFDRPAFGLTERPMPPYPGENPYSFDANARQLIGMMDALGIRNAVLVGHSAGGAAAVYAAATYPTRVEALVLVAPAVYEARSVPTFASALLRTPQARRVGPLFVRRIAGEGADDFIRSAYADPGQVTEEVLEGYRRPLAAENWDRALWEFTAAPRPRSAADVIDDVRAPTLVVTGDADTFVAPENSRRVYETLADSGAVDDVSIEEFEGVGHLPHEERPEQFATEVFRFVDRLPVACET